MLKRFGAKIIHIGTSAGIIVPSKMLKERGLKVGERAEFVLLLTQKEKRKIIDELAGSMPGLGEFKRDKDRSEKLLKMAGRPIKQIS
ncbi:MAG TPA: hypothetical protein VL944_02460 [Candidatus Acidoferrum sp.]|nr:hypothetical protein [Candidatus Acidoferrum sp.]